MHTFFFSFLLIPEAFLFRIFGLFCFLVPSCHLCLVSAFSPVTRCIPVFIIFGTKCFYGTLRNLVIHIPVVMIYPRIPVTYNCVSFALTSFYAKMRPLWLIGGSALLNVNIVLRIWPFHLIAGNGRRATANIKTCLPFWPVSCCHHHRKEPGRSGWSHTCSGSQQWSETRIRCIQAPISWRSTSASKIGFYKTGIRILKFWIWYFKHPVVWDCIACKHSHRCVVKGNGEWVSQWCCVYSCSDKMYLLTFFN